MKQKTKNVVKAMALGFVIITFSKPIGMCFLIMGEIIVNAGELIKQVF